MDTLKTECENKTRARRSDKSYDSIPEVKSVKQRTV